VSPAASAARPPNPCQPPPPSALQVTISNRNRCTCPDSWRGICKHVIFVMNRVLRVPPHNPLSWQSGLLVSELSYIFDHAPDPTRDRCVLADDAVRYAAAKFQGRSLSLVTPAEDAGGGGGDAAGAAGEAAPAAAAAGADGKRKPGEGTWVWVWVWGGGRDGALHLPFPPTLHRRCAVSADDDCPICFEPLGANDAVLTWCDACGNSMHSQCMTMWARGKPAGGVTCVYCRAVWVDPRRKPAGGGGGGGHVHTPAPLCASVGRRRRRRLEEEDVPQAVR